MRFASAADLRYVIDTYGADKGGSLTFGRLADYVDGDPNRFGESKQQSMLR